MDLHVTCDIYIYIYHVHVVVVVECYEGYREVATGWRERGREREMYFLCLGSNTVRCGREKRKEGRRRGREPSRRDERTGGFNPPVLRALGKVT